MTAPQADEAPLSTVPEQEWRYEVKLVTPGSVVPLARSWIRAHRGVFSESFPPRIVNNLYLDTHDMQWLDESVEGLSERRKVRLRWYGEQTGSISASFEVKRKSDRANWKLRSAVAEPIELNTGATWPEIVTRSLKSLPGWIRAEIGADLVPVLVNRYRREYYEDRSGNLRITVDSGQDVYDQRLSARPNFMRRAPRRDGVVIEVKGPLDEWERIKEVASDLPIRVTRNSKYALGCELIGSI
jgi:hypothetical protein